MAKNLDAMRLEIPEADLNRVLGPDGMQNLYELAKIASVPENLAKTQSQIEALSPQGYLGKAIKTVPEAALW